MGMWGATVVLVLAIIGAAWNSSIQRACRIDPIAADFGSRPLGEEVWKNAFDISSVERIVVGPDPEDLAFDSQGRIYTALQDGWIKRIGVDGTVENHTYVGGRPLGIALGPEEEIYFVDVHEGLFRISKDGVVHLLSNQVDGRKFRFADGVVVAKNGVVYFTDASSKFGILEHMLDIFESQPNGQLLQYDPATSKTTVVLPNLFFPNGVALSENEDFLLICETSRARILRYWLKGTRQGTVDTFIDGLPGFPDNVRLSDGNFYVGMPGGRTWLSDWMFRQPFKHLRCFLAQSGPLNFMKKFNSRAVMIIMSPDGKVLQKYADSSRKQFAMITGGIKAGDFLYFCGIGNNFVGRLRVQSSSSSIS